VAGLGAVPGVVRPDVDKPLIVGATALAANGTVSEPTKVGMVVPTTQSPA